MRNAIIYGMALWLTACAVVPPIVCTEPDFKAVITQHNDQGTQIQCVLVSDTPVQNVWRSLSVVSGDDQYVLPYTVIESLENMEAREQISVTEQHLWGRDRSSIENVGRYYSSATLWVENPGQERSIQLNIQIGDQSLKRRVSL